MVEKRDFFHPAQDLNVKTKKSREKREGMFATLDRVING
jgi:hypothetical protein